MDIGDPSEIPSTRKKLPSMQELGAFDPEPPTSTPSPPALDKPTPASKPPRPTSEQLRAALKRADPATRIKLLRLIAGGRTVEQAAALEPDASAPSRRLAMNLPRSPTRPEPPTADARPDSAKPIHRQLKAAATATGGETLLKIDANTDLLEAAAAPLSVEQRKAALQQQLAASRAQETPRAETASAPKVLFPAYDPREHGDDVRQPARRSKAPVEGHFPAPRQPFQARYQHADGRPMNEEETKVEEVLQEQRCEQTLQVLARDGVNGLLLSPRDLDAAVENGTLDEPTATLLWKTWSALRPVIHVIDDQPIPRDGEAAAPQLAIDFGNPATEESAPVEDEVTTAENQSGAGPVPVLDIEPSLSPAPPARMEEKPQQPIATKTLAEALAISAPAPGPAPSAVESPEPQPAAIPARPDVEPQPASDPSHGGRKHRSTVVLRQLLRAFAALCVVYTSVQFGAWAWLRWGHWLLG